MEKYRRFADHGSGINPFVPVNPKRANAFIRYVKEKLELQIDITYFHHKLIDLWNPAIFDKTPIRSLDFSVILFISNHILSLGNKGERVEHESNQLI